MTTAILALLFLVTFSSYAAAGSTDVATLVDRWQAIEVTSNGEPPPEGMLQRLTMVFKEDTVSIMGAAPTRYRVDASASPARIDILNSRRQVGIFEVKRDELRICVGMDGDRPSSFQTQKYTDHTYMRLKRVK
jgi:uncharacterized protein (TIGR03067 family)